MQMLIDHEGHIGYKTIEKMLQNPESFCDLFFTNSILRKRYRAQLKF